MRKTATGFVIWLMLAAGIVAAWFAHRDLWLTRVSEGLATSAREWNPHVAIPLATVLAGLLAVIALNGPEIARALGSRRAVAGANVALMVVLACGIAVILNLIAYRHYRQFDWTLKGIYTLTERTESVAENLPRKVTAHVIGAPYHPYYATVRGTLDMLRAASRGKLEVDYLETTRDRDKVLRTLQALGVNPKDLEDPDENPLVIFESTAPGAPQARTKQLTFNDVVDVDYSGGRAPRLRAFKAEELFVEALLELTRDKPTGVVLLTGHGELEPAGRREDERLSTLEKTLKRLGYKVDTFAFDFAKDSARARLPADCDVLAIVGAQSRFDDRELAEIRAFLTEGGRLIVFGEPILRRRPDSGSVFFDDPRLNTLLKDYGLELEPAYIFDAATTLPLGEFSFAPAVGGIAAQHAIVKPLAGLRLLFNVAQPVLVEPPEEPGAKARPQSILDSAAGAIAIRDMDALKRTRDPYRTDHRKGPITLAAVSTRAVEAPTATAAAPEAPTGTAAAARRSGEARVVVVGDATVASDDSIGNFPQNLDFLVNAFAWLSAREETIAIGTKAPEVIRLRVTEEDRYRVLLLSLVELPLACALLGLAAHWIRRS